MDTAHHVGAALGFDREQRFAIGLLSDQVGVDRKPAEIEDNPMKRLEFRDAGQGRMRVGVEPFGRLPIQSDLAKVLVNLANDLGFLHGKGRPADDARGMILTRRYSPPATHCSR